VKTGKAHDYVWTPIPYFSTVMNPVQTFSTAHDETFQPLAAEADIQLS
jgi:hypothetical protein